MAAASVTDIVNAIEAAGVVGAGGAGFPTHVKLSTAVGTVIANGAECEPLLEADYAVMALEPARVLAGLEIAMAVTGATRGYVAVKEKRGAVLRVMDDLVKREKGISVCALDDVYPIGDEHVLVNEVTGRHVPEGGLPLEAGVVVNNVATLAAVADAVDGRPVTSRYVTVAGAVARPVTARFPIGTSVADAIAFAGGPLTERYRVILGGPIMGKLAPDTAAVVTKVTGGIIVLPVDHPLVRTREADIGVIIRQARAACCQCMSCTETCPRHLLGHRIAPHLIMRAVTMWSASGPPPDTIASAWLCSECAVCATVGCPSGLSPVRVNQALKQSMARKGMKNPYHEKDISSHPLRTARRVPSSRMVTRSGIASYVTGQGRGLAEAAAEADGKAGARAGVRAGAGDGTGARDRAGGTGGHSSHTECVSQVFQPNRVDIPLLQHAGAPAVPCVRIGDEVREGQPIAEIPPGKLGARIHASISGRVTGIGDAITIEAGRRGR
ncbi:MAG: SLBB domain-containing protein [Firmicutes bacterium]|jgi:Na+-translocating ferredoxin:NAD+ oxidoreductase RnfC subunit|nr:SLBB domain-containing protein [Bacillota bacterium]MDH7495440.1 SLBB domain-containing protein [Bacillota bacterium]